MATVAEAGWGGKEFMAGEKGVEGLDGFGGLRYGHLAHTRSTGLPVEPAALPPAEKRKVSPAFRTEANWSPPPVRFFFLGDNA